MFLASFRPFAGSLPNSSSTFRKPTMQAKGMKQKEAAQAIGMSQTGFSDLLNGRRPLSFETARSLYNTLGVPAEVIFA